MPEKYSKSHSLTDALYIGKSTIFKIFLLSGVIIISVVFIWYTFNVIDKLKKDTHSQVEKYVRMWQLAANSNMSGNELQFIFDEIIVKANFPIIVLDENREPIHWRNIEGIPVGDTTKQTLNLLKKMAEKMIKQNGEFHLVFSNAGNSFINYFCYGDTKAINQLEVMPFVEIGIILAFMIVAMIGFQNIRKSEERHIWVGIAKETAHQLGTPISSLMGWLEVIESEKDSGKFNKEEQDIINETIRNMKVDVIRLKKVANRFGQIGSVPELKPCNLNDIIQEVVDYYSRRLPFEGKGIAITFPAQNLPQISLNSELFSWSLENMVKNSLQAVDSKTGIINITTELHSDKKQVILNIIDNGKGISSAAARKIFRPGFTTKKRGWGLGLTLVKRIIEEYHGGKISLKKSKPGETVFEIILPVEKG